MVGHGEYIRSEIYKDLTDIFYYSSDDRCHVQHKTGQGHSCNVQVHDRFPFSFIPYRMDKHGRIGIIISSFGRQKNSL